MGNHSRTLDSARLSLLLGLVFATTACADPQSATSNVDELEVSETAPSKDTVDPLPPDEAFVLPSEEDDSGVQTADSSSDTPSEGDGQIGPSEDSDAGAEDSVSVDDTTVAGDAEEPVPGFPIRTCTTALRFQGTSSTTTVQFASSLTNWADAPLSLTETADDLFALDLDTTGFTPGSYGYKFIVDGQWTIDPDNKMKRFDDGTVNSKLIVPDCTKPEFTLIERTSGTDDLRVTVQLSQGTEGKPDLASLVVRHNFEPTDSWTISETGLIEVTLTDLPTGKHTLRFDIDSAQGAAKTLATSSWLEAEPFEWADSVMYFAFTDRFKDGKADSAPEACLPDDSLGNWLGGDWPGVTSAIESGYFDDLGVNTLWLNAPMDNPDGCVPGMNNKTYTSYHGYFPVDLMGPEERYGTMDDLKDLVKAAHARGIRVLVDLPANHLYETAPEYVTGPADWFNQDGICREQGWEPVETCWFESYLPDLNYQNDAVVDYMVEIAIWWAIEADLDGFRVDAVKHMHQHFLYTLRAELDSRIEEGTDLEFYTVGETFTGGWQPGGGSEAELIAAYISDDQLYGQFDFPLFWPLRGAFAYEDTALSWLGEVALGTDAYYGPGSIMSSFLGNHDVTRFISEAAGNIPNTCPGGSNVVAWDCPPEQPTDTEPYERLKRAFVFLAAHSAIPLIYYGDEIGLAGAGDPDNRRMMRWDGLNAEQDALHATVGTLMNARRDSAALRRGSLSIPSSGDNHLAIARRLGDNRAFALFNRGSESYEFSLPNAGTEAFEDVLSGDTVTPTGGALTVTVPARGTMLLTQP